jgi:hypothetical protein
MAAPKNDSGVRTYSDGRKGITGVPVAVSGPAATAPHAVAQPGVNSKGAAMEGWNRMQQSASMGHKAR